MDNFEEILKEKRIIKQFKKNGNLLVHPFSAEETSKSSKSMDIYLYTLGHLWLYFIFEQYGYGEYLQEIVIYSIKRKNALFEWEIEDDIEKDLRKILNKYNIQFRRFLFDDFNLMDHKEIDEKSKDKEQPLVRLTKLLVMAELEMADELVDQKKELKILLEDEGSIINAIYLGIVMTGGEDKVFSKVPQNFIDIIKKNMSCYHDEYEMKYYPKLDELMRMLDFYVQIFEKDWYLIPDDEQVIISKFLYSVQIVRELSLSLLGLNGILASVSTRIMFDNYWQSLYLIKNKEIKKYREFVHKRMRLHILKRDDGTDVNIDELLREVEDGFFDPIPVNGDYFSKSAREYAIELGIKDDYDKFYEFNSEFIHSSLTAVYSGIMVPCRNPEHNGHLMIKSGGARLVEAVPGIVYILNNHIDLVNKYLEEEMLPKLNIEGSFQTRDEWVQSVDMFPRTFKR